ncbi:MAG: hypothetical protein J6127_06785 [Clostridiales bacterium]|nr:hypothetical protein [Clostridiales bacterium]
MNAYFYRLFITIKRRPIADILAVVGIFASVMSVRAFDRVPVHLMERDTETVLGIMTLLLIICFDYAFVVGFRSGVLGYHPADMTFQFAAPFKKVFNLFVSFPYGLGSLAVFIWLICTNSPVLNWWISFSKTDLVVFVIEAFFVMMLTFMFTSFISARFCDNKKAIVLTLVSLFMVHFILFGVIIGGLINEYGSFSAVRAERLVVILTKCGNSLFADVFPVAGWTGLIYKGILHGNPAVIPLVVIAYLIVCAGVFLLYKNAEFDFYETAGLNTGRIIEIIEASKAGVEAVNTGIARTAKVGNEVYKRGWGSSAFFHMHLFENLRSSKLFFINKVAMIYRVFALILLLITDSLLPEDLDLLVIIVGMTTMMVLNAIVFGGGKTVMEMGRPYFFMIPEKPTRKLAMCILADLPEMLFDAVVCTFLVKLVTWNDFTWLPMIAFVLMMTSFDLLSQTVGIVCVKLLKQFGKFSMMIARYILIVVLLVAGMIPSDLVTNSLTGSLLEDLSSVLTVMIGMLALTYFAMWGLMILISWKLFDRA